MITSVRILGAVALIFLKPLSIPFFIVYSFCGLSDAVDGLVARKLKITSEFGSKLDSVADLTFYTVMMLKLIIKLIEVLSAPLWIMLGVVLAVRISAYLLSAFRLRKFASNHTILNKITGGLVFAIPYFIIWSPILFNIYGGIVCVVAFVAAVEELVCCAKQDKIVKY